MDLLSPRKKRRTLEPADDTDTFTTPKKIRADLLIKHSSKSPSKQYLSTSASTSLPLHLSRLLNIQTSLQHALSVALATSAVSPCTDTGRVPNVLTHLSLTSNMGFKVTCGVDDIKRLCWLWEWDGVTIQIQPAADDEGEEKNENRTRFQTKSKVVKTDEDEDNPFIDNSSKEEEEKEEDGNGNRNMDWIRGSMGFVVTPTTHFVKTESRRVPAYGIGIEVEIDLLAEGMGGGMSSVARWTGDGETRKKELERKLKAWAEIHKDKEPNIPPIPLASLPPIPTTSSPTKLSSLTALLKSKSRTNTPLSTPSPKRTLTLARTPSSRTAIPKFIFPTPPSKNNSIPFPSTTPQTPIGSPTKYIFTSVTTIPSVITPRNELRTGPISESEPDPESDFDFDTELKLNPKTKSKPNLKREPGSRPTSPTKSAGLSLLSRSLANASSSSSSSIPESPSPSPSLSSPTKSAFPPSPAIPFPPQTPSTAGRTGLQFHPETPKSGSGTRTPTSTSTSTAAATAATPRRAALLERIRLKSLSSDDLDPSSPSLSTTKSGDGGRSGSGSGSMTKEQLRLLGQEEMKRRVLLGRLDEVAATVWAAFSSPSQTMSTPLSVARKRRTMRFDEIVRAVVSSSRVPISSADAQDSVTLLMNLCPFFLKPLIIEGEEWVEMPASNPNHPTTPPSPRRKNVSEEEVRNRSPKSVRMEAKGGLRDVRERIRREIEECSI